MTFPHFSAAMLQVVQDFIPLPHHIFSMPQPIDIAIVVLIFVVLSIGRYVWIRRTRRRTSELYAKALQDQETFLKTFLLAPFRDFSSFNFYQGHLDFGHVSPFPEFAEGQWRYRIVLNGSESEDIATINHEISECTVGRLMENLLNLDKPLYLQRKEHDKFWIHGKKQKYLIEHLLTTLGEISDLTNDTLETRVNKEDREIWLNS